MNRKLLNYLKVLPFAGALLISTSAWAQDEEPQDDATAESPAAPATPTVPAAWSRFDFVPGTRVIFEDDLVAEELGEFPSKWTLMQGSADVVNLDGQHAIQYAGDVDVLIKPLIRNFKGLPAAFTLEFDMYVPTEDRACNGNDQYWINFYDGDQYSETVNGSYNRLRIYQNYGTAQIGPESFPEQFNGKLTERALAEMQGKWVRVSIAVNQRSLKVYLNQHRVLNVPNMTGKPTAIVFGSWGNICNEDRSMNFIRNVRIAEGGKKLYDQAFTDGRIVARGILFDTGKATLRPESNGILAEIAKLLTENPTLRFRIEGHTDSDGDDAANLRLSEARANVVKAALTQRGIAADRLETKGMGETKPLSLENTPEAKANNRRVEFVKL